MRILPAFAVALFIAAGAMTTQASPLMPAKALVSPEASDEATLVRHRRHWRHHRHWRHYGWHRGHHYGWYKRHHRRWR